MCTVVERLMQTIKQSFWASKMDQTALNKRLANFFWRIETHHTQLPVKPLPSYLWVRETVEWQQDKMISQPARVFGKGTQSANTENRKKVDPWYHSCKNRTTLIWSGNCLRPHGEDILTSWNLPSLQHHHYLCPY